MKRPLDEMAAMEAASLTVLQQPDRMAQAGTIPPALPSAG